jgi:hypothetical protein
MQLKGEGMAEILRHRREPRLIREKTNILIPRKSSVYSTQQGCFWS